METPDMRASGTSMSINAPTPSSWAFKPSLDTSSWLPRTQAAAHQQRASLATLSSMQTPLSSSVRMSLGSINSSKPTGANGQALEHALQQQQQQQQQQQRVPMDVLLAPLLPSAEEGKLVERVSQLRLALEESQCLVGSLQQRNAGLQQNLEAQQQESHQMQLQLVTQRHAVALLGGNLQGRLSLAQGKVVAELQEELSARSTAIAASEARLQGFQAELDRISSSFGAKLVAEQRERERLAAEAAQSRLLCSARARQAAVLQAELETTQAALQRAQSTHHADATQLAADNRSLLKQLQQAQQAADSATSDANAAQGALAAAEAAKGALAQQIKELQASLADMRLQSEWLEGKVADLENCDPGSKGGHWRSQDQQVASSLEDTAELKQQLRTAHVQLELMQQQLKQQQRQQQQQQQQQQEVEDAQALHAQLLAAQATMQTLQAEAQTARAEAALASQHLASAQQQLQELRSTKPPHVNSHQAYVLQKQQRQDDESQLPPLPELSTGSWESVHDNPEFDTSERDQHCRHQWQEDPQQQQENDCILGEQYKQHEQRQQQLHRQQQQQKHSSPGGPWHSARIHDLEDTVSSLRRQLRAQEQAMAALHKQSGLQVHDSAASRAGWADALGLLSDEAPSPVKAAGRPMHRADGAAADGSLVLLRQQHRHSGDGAEAANRAGSPDSCDSVATQTELASCGGRECGVQTDSPAAGVSAQNALLAAARMEIQRLKEINHQLLESHAAGARSSVSLEDAKKAVAQAKQAASKKGQDALERANHSWAARLATLQADHAALEDQVKGLTQQNKDLATALTAAQESAGQLRDAQCTQLEAELAGARREAEQARERAEELRQRLAAMAVSHDQELEQVRMDCESDAAAAIMEAHATAAHEAAQHQRAFEAQAAEQRRTSAQQEAELQASYQQRRVLEQQAAQQAAQLQALSQQRHAAEQQAAQQAAQLQAMAARVDELSATILQQQALLAAQPQPQPQELPAVRQPAVTAAVQTDAVAAVTAADAVGTWEACTAGWLSSLHTEHQPVTPVNAEEASATSTKGAASEHTHPGHDTGHAGTSHPTLNPDREQHNGNGCVSAASAAAPAADQLQLPALHVHTFTGSNGAASATLSAQPPATGSDAQSASSHYDSHQTQQQQHQWQSSPLGQQTPTSWGASSSNVHHAAQGASGCSAWDALDADDDVCRVSSASGTPSHTQNRRPERLPQQQQQHQPHHQQQQQQQQQQGTDRHTAYSHSAARYSPSTANSPGVPLPAPSATPLQTRAAYGSGMRLRPPSEAPQLSSRHADGPAGTSAPNSAAGSAFSGLRQQPQRLSSSGTVERQSQHLHSSAYGEPGGSAFGSHGAAYGGAERAFDGRSSAGASSLDTLAQDVFGALSLSRYHKERSRVQEVRAAQHALAASLHEDAAMRLRADRHLAGSYDAGAHSPGAAPGTQPSAAQPLAAAGATYSSTAGLPPLHRGHALPVPSRTAAVDHSIGSASLYQAAAAASSSQRTSMSLPLGTTHPGVAAAVERAAAAAGAASSSSRWQHPTGNNRYTSS